MNKIVFTSLVLLCIYGLTSKVLGANGEITTGQNSSDYQIYNNGEQGFRIVNRVGSLNYTDIKINEESFIKLSIPGYGVSNKIGYPDLPVRRKLIEIPLNSNVKIIVNDYTIKEYDLSELGVVNNIIPVQPPRRRDTLEKPFQMNLSAYLSDTYITVLDSGTLDELNLVSVEKLGIKRNAFLARLNIAPVQYNPVTQKLIVFEYIDFEALFEQPDIYGTYQMKTKIGLSNLTGADYLMNEIPLDSKQTKGVYESVSNPIKYVIIADTMFKETLQPFISWKIRKGFNVIVTYTTDPEIGGSNYVSIRAYLKGLYDNATVDDPAPTYVLIAGDLDQVPTNPSIQRDAIHPTDFYYVEYTGDYLPEAYVGRLSATTTDQLKAQIDKIIEYEKYEMPDPSFLNDAVLIAGDDADYAPTYGNGQINYLADNYFNSINGYTNAHVYLYPASISARLAIMQNFNNGIGFFDYTGHGYTQGTGAPSLTTLDFYNYVENKGKYPVVIINGCDAGDFAILGECFGEYLMRGVNKGAIGYIGATNVAFWDEDYWWSNGYGAVSANPKYDSSGLGTFDRLFHTHGEPIENWQTSLGEMIYSGNMAVVESGSKESDYYWEIYNLLGDPSLMPYLSAASPMNATFSKPLALGDTSFTVTTEPYAYVAISRNDTLLSAVQADGSGLAELTFEAFETPGFASIVVTKQNKIPVIDSVLVVGTNPYIIYAGSTINDDLGNNNGEADYNESISLDVALANIGVTSSTGLTATLSTNDEYVTLTDSTADWGGLSVNDTATVLNAFGLQINQAVPDQHRVELALNITDGTESWQQAFHFTINSFSFELGDVIMNDTITGNGNGKIEVGETVTLKVPVINTGHVDAINLSATFVCPDSYLSANNPIDTLSGLNIGAQDYFTFQVTATSKSKGGVTANFDVMVNSYIPVVKEYSVSAGFLIEDAEGTSIAESSVDWDLTQEFPWAFTDAVFYTGSQSLQSATIGDNQSSVLLVEYNVVEAGEISFDATVSSQAYGDKLTFYINDILKMKMHGALNPWNHFSFPLDTGKTVFKWVYSKNGSVSDGEDKAWVDNIVFPQVISYDTATITDTDIVTTCESYAWIDGITYTESNNTATYTLNDTLFTLDLTILKPDSVTQNVSTCDSYMFEGNILTTSGQYQAAFTNLQGCDSIVTLNLTILKPDSVTQNVSACESYDFNGNVLTVSGQYQAAYINQMGCDSIVTINLLINNNGPLSVLSNVDLCYGENYTYPDGFTETGITSNTSHVSNLISVLGCDSIITTNITVKEDIVVNEEVSICLGEDCIYPDGTTETNITANTSHESVLTSSLAGCDSTVITTVTVYPVHIETQRVNVYLGDDYIYPDGTIETNITASKVHRSKLSSAIGCDSLITTLITVDTTDTVVVSGINKTTNIKRSIWPNPTTNNVYLALSDNDYPYYIQISDLSGRLLSSKSIELEVEIIELELPLKQGMYYIKVTSETKITTYKVIKE